jgi:hypothetical protein
VGSTAGLDIVVHQKHPCPCSELDPSCPFHSLVTILTELSQFSLGQKMIAILGGLCMCRQVFLLMKNN